ncbi:uncharacterized protein BT62DRAFT_461677 [Guyanagaster necrorhizus]|uniref:Uncharacterized protein n=1 Tax=Guyanagaster necrorhizus TaxID=856835 RepID=A0A9P7VIY8_9AGAR|nr:uncharacterized protein BT62DRAFT_461677 [Guyanagaster necrorhizus MCA 3950]KAG7441961.1 hypothetical protein BT62DRAFT_461677 [Guyanagaster necrorhizus MCA 3950]
MDHAPPLLDVYMKWTKLVDLILMVDELLNGAKLLWVGLKCLGKIIFHCHGPNLSSRFPGSWSLNVELGGAYNSGSPDALMAFCRHLQLELEKHNISVEVETSAYSEFRSFELILTAFVCRALTRESISHRVPGCQGCHRVPSIGRCRRRE